MTLILDQSFIADFHALAESLDHPELSLAAQLTELAWRQIQASQDLRHRWSLLSYRQQQVAMFIYAGRTFPQISRELNIGIESVRTHARLTYAKMGVATKKDLRALLLSSDLLEEYMEKFNKTLLALY